MLALNFLYFLMEDVDKIILEYEFPTYRIIQITCGIIGIVFFSIALKHKKKNPYPYIFIGLLAVFLIQFLALVPKSFITFGVILILIVCSIIFEKLKLKILSKCFYGVCSLLFLGQIGYFYYNYFVIMGFTLHEIKEGIIFFAPYIILVVSYFLISLGSFFLIFKKDNE